MLVGSVANGLNSFGSSSPAYVSSLITSASMVPCSFSLPHSWRPSQSPALEGINLLRNIPSILSTLQDNACSILVEALMVYSHTSSSITHINVRSATPSVSASAMPIVVVTGLTVVATVNFTIVVAIAAIWW